MLEKKNDPLIAAKAVLARYGSICGMILHSQLSQVALDQWKAILAALGAARLGIRRPDAFNPHTGRRNNHASHAPPNYACCEPKTPPVQRTYPLQGADP